MTSVIVADTSVIINGYLADQIESGSIRNSEVIIPQAVFDELQSQASNHKQQGFIGLEQIQKLNKLSGSFGLKIILKGSHPSIDDIKFAEAYQNGVNRQKYWKYALEDTMNLVAKIPMISARIYR